MAEFKLKRGQKVYHIRKFSSVVELARRRLIAPEDTVYVPSVGKWVYASAIHELRPLLTGTVPPADELEELPLEFVEPLAEDADGLSIEIDIDDLDIELLDENTFEPAEPEPEPDETPSPSAAPQDLWSDLPGADWSQQLETPPRYTAGAASPQAHRDEYSPTDPSSSRSNNGRTDAIDLLEPAPTRAPLVTPRPVSFQDWMAQKAMNGDLDPGADGLLPLINPVEAPSEEAAKVNWWRLGTILAVVLVAFGIFFIYVKLIANLEFETWNPTGPKKERTDVTMPVPQTVDPTAPDPAIAAMDLEIRKIVPPHTSAFYSFDQAQDKLFGELFNLKIGVADAKLDPIDGDRTRPVRRTDADLTVRIKPGSTSTEMQTGTVGAIAGKYVSRNKLRIRNLILKLELPDHPTLVRMIPGQVASDYFSGAISLQQFLLAAQAGTVVP